MAVERRLCNLVRSDVLGDPACLHADVAEHSGWGDEESDRLTAVPFTLDGSGTESCAGPELELKSAPKILAIPPGASAYPEKLAPLTIPPG